MKACTKCGETKPLDEYYRRKNARDGRRSWCKTCMRAHKAEYDARPMVKAHRANYYIENRGRMLTRSLAYHQENPHVGWEGFFRRRATAYGFTPRVESFTQGELYERWGTHCYHCGSEDGTTLDHWPQPVSRGGEHSLDNCRPSCMSCQYQSWKPGFTPTKETTA